MTTQNNIVKSETVNGTFNHHDSWEKGSVWDLDNGWQACTSWNVIYGEFVSRLSKDGKAWHASDGYDNPYATSSDPMIARIFKDHLALPDFARDWIEIINKTSGDTLVTAKFTKNFPPKA